MTKYKNLYNPLKGIEDNSNMGKTRHFSNERQILSLETNSISSIKSKEKACPCKNFYNHTIGIDPFPCRYHVCRFIHSREIKELWDVLKKLNSLYGKGDFFTDQTKNLKRNLKKILDNVVHFHQSNKEKIESNVGVIDSYKKVKEKVKNILKNRDNDCDYFDYILEVSCYKGDLYINPSIKLVSNEIYKILVDYCSYKNCRVHLCSKSFHNDNVERMYPHLSQILLDTIYPKKQINLGDLKDFPYMKDKLQNIDNSIDDNSITTGKWSNGSSVSTLIRSFDINLFENSPRHNNLIKISNSNKIPTLAFKYNHNSTEEINFIGSHKQPPKEFVEMYSIKKQTSNYSLPNLNVLFKDFIKWDIEMFGREDSYDTEPQSYFKVDKNIPSNNQQMMEDYLDKFSAFFMIRKEDDSRFCCPTINIFNFYNDESIKEYKNFDLVQNLVRYIRNGSLGSKCYKNRNIRESFNSGKGYKKNNIGNWLATLDRDNINNVLSCLKDWPEMSWSRVKRLRSMSENSSVDGSIISNFGKLMPQFEVSMSPTEAFKNHLNDAMIYEPGIKPEVHYILDQYLRHSDYGTIDKFYKDVERIRNEHKVNNPRNIIYTMIEAYMENSPESNNLPEDKMREIAGELSEAMKNQTNWMICSKSRKSDVLNRLLVNKLENEGIIKRENI